ncbi:MAG TPA: M14 family zinc carboxypeptidase [Nocardioidaceae bacterium]|nr:M14 family zinc carboxypeptidase [Nocardioidaceae bacterium]
MRKRSVTLLSAAALVATSLAVLTIPSSAEPECSAFGTTPEFRGTTPTPEQVLGFPIGSQEVTTAQSDAYLAAVDTASDMVVTGTAATSVQGRPLRYAVVGRPDNVTPAGLQSIRSRIGDLKDPATPADEAAELAATTPAILYLQANVHGGEESGTDALLRVLYELADRTDCAAGTILDHAIVVMLPIQNPDGREADTRRNAYGFDMNRDWMARTQPETDGKIELLRQYPPQLDLDEHEFGFFDYFFPPNSDPIYHEVSDTVKGWNDAYGAAFAAEFDRQKIQFFNYEPYDFFGAIFGDTVPSLSFNSAGITLEKYSGDPISQRTYEHYVTTWTALFEAGSDKTQLLTDWHGAWVEAYQEGVEGVLEPNAVFQKTHKLLQPVPDARVRSYFLLDDSTKAYETQSMVRRLQRMDVDVYRLTRPTTVPGFHPYGRAGRDETLPAGTYWIPLAQAEKHWIQAMLNEDTYIPYDVTFDVTAWSNPLLMNVPGGWTGAVVSPSAQLVDPVAEPTPPAPPADPPTIGLFQIPSSSAAIESAGAVRWLFDQRWDLDFTDLTADDIRSGALAGLDELVIPDGYANYGLQALGSKGKKAMVDWVNGGGRLIAWAGGAEIATRIGASTAVLSPANTNMPGSLVRMRIDQSSPLGQGVGPFAYAMFNDDAVMSPGRGTSVATFPSESSEDFFVSGLDIGAESLAETSAVVDEAVGQGRAITFSFDPTFRAWTDGTARIFRNALLTPDPATMRAAAPVGSPTRAAAERTARAAASTLPQVPSPIRLTVSDADTRATAAVIDSLHLRSIRVDAGPVMRFLIANPHGWSAEEHPKLGPLLQGLSDANVPIRALSMP